MCRGEAITETELLLVTIHAVLDHAKASVCCVTLQKSLIELLLVLVTYNYALFEHVNVRAMKLNRRTDL